MKGPLNVLYFSWLILNVSNVSFIDILCNKLSSATELNGESSSILGHVQFRFNLNIREQATMF